MATPTVFLILQFDEISEIYYISAIWYVGLIQSGVSLTPLVFVICMYVQPFFYRMADKFEQFQDLIRSHKDHLCDALKDEDSLHSFILQLYKKKQLYPTNFDSAINEILTYMTVLLNEEKLDEAIDDFFNALKYVGKPAEGVATMLQKKWKKRAKLDTGKLCR